MKTLFTLLFASLFTLAQADNVFDKLAEVNRYWREQKDIASIGFSQSISVHDNELIKLHLSLVEQTLRKRDCHFLTSEQKNNRLKALDILHQYWLLGNFPQNEIFGHRQPIFIDKYDNFCAVGYLVKATGFEPVSRMIAAQTNYAYVKEMKYPELTEWANKFGFTVDELAWIQPTYAPKSTTSSVGKGADGVVNELFADTSAQVLYVGGEFEKVDSAITANNIAYITESSGIYTWHNMGMGVHGKVNAIAKYGSNIFVAGNIDSAGGIAVNNVAYWNGTSWNAAGCINGVINDLVEYKGKLYACGSMSICSAPSAIGNFAVWNGSSWQLILSLTGTINTMMVVDTMLYLGGNFSYASTAVNAIKWNPYTGFQTFANSLRNEVKEFGLLRDTVYVACKLTSTSDPGLFRKLKGNSWDSLGVWRYSANGTMAINTICANADTLMLGGNFYDLPVVGTFYQNCQSYSPIQYNFLVDPFWVDSAINKMIVFRNRIFFAGSFINGSKKLNRIGYMNAHVTSYAVFANATAVNACGGAGGSASAFVGLGLPPYRYSWSNGDTTKNIYNLGAGQYTLVVTDSRGDKDTVIVNVNNVVIDTTVKNVGNALLSNNTSASYRWMDCDTHSLLPDTGSIFTPAKTGTYCVIIKKDVCVDTSTCYYFDINGTTVNTISIDSGNIIVSPNPVNDVINIEFRNLNATNISIIDATGKLLFTEKVVTAGVQVNMSEYSKGVYSLVVKDAANHIFYFKIAK
ncbi:MAG: T9SS type A sorting domain-containing protein [Bacteroidetes bacterium]|nr:T9SS type A sorting domain-containing protein [Bacteroidota bacterium]